MKVLVTGARGFLGSHLVPYLIEKQYQVKVLLRPQSASSSKGNENHLSASGEYAFLKQVEVVEGDVTDLESFDKAAQNTEVMFHLAGYTGFLAVNNLEAKRMMWEVNVNGTTHAISICQKRDLTLVHMSSVVTVGAGFRSNQILNEKSSYMMKGKGLAYFDSKKEAEKRVLEACRENKLKAVILNPSSITGARDMKKRARSLQKKVAMGNFYFYSRGGINVVDVESVVKATENALHKGQRGERYILSGENLTMKQYFNIIAQCSGVSPPFIPVPGFLLKVIGYIGSLFCYFGFPVLSITREVALISTLYHWYDNTKAKKELDFAPQPAEKSIDSSIRWWKNAKYSGNQVYRKSEG